MTIGEHLDELRGCVIRSLLALVIACLVCIWPAKYILAIIARPVVLALRHHGQPDTFLQTSPLEGFLVYVKVVVISGILLSGPYIIVQLWNFVASGLYRHERAAVYRLLPMSVGLFFAGVAFMYVCVLAVTLNFLIGFSVWLPMPDARPNALEAWLLSEPEVAATQPAPELPPQVADVNVDPEHPEPGAIWFNRREQKLKVRVGDETYSTSMQRDDRRSMMTTHFRIGEYLTFVLALTIAFGLAFQVPLVVVFLAAVGIVTVGAFRKSRKIVILAIVIIAGMIAPPDLFSHLLLSGPMILLFEIGLLIAARAEKRRARARTQG